MDENDKVKLAELLNEYMQELQEKLDDEALTPGEAANLKQRIATIEGIVWEILED